MNNRNCNCHIEIGENRTDLKRMYDYKFSQKHNFLNSAFKSATSDHRRKELFIAIQASLLKKPLSDVPFDFVKT
jgi:hypothetical protein